jgi:D-3-phosphoglycerate dehydrogenase / 2-oxoglutarate reductase
VKDNISVLITDPIEQGCADILSAEGFKVDTKLGLSEEDLCREIKPYSVLIVRSGTQVTRRVIESADNLKIIGRAGTGVDNIDVDAATRRGVIVMNTPGGNTISTAEHTVSLLLALARNIPQAYTSLQAGKWDRKTYKGNELFGKTLGIVGFGKIGKEVGLRLKSFGMHVVAYDPLVSADAMAKHNFESVSIDELLRRSDYITVHTPLNDETRGIIGEEAFTKCKKGVRVVNCARGGIIDEQALLTALQAGNVAGAALDVFETEPPAENPLLKHPRVIATPHLGASTVEAQEKVALQIAHQLADALKQRSMVGAVNISAALFSVREDHKPFVDLADRLGKIAGQLMDGKLQTITFSTRGESLQVSYDVLKSVALRGILSSRLSEPVNEVNAAYFARELGIAVNERRDDASGLYTHLLTLDYATDRNSRTISGTVFGSGVLRLVNVDGFPVEVNPEGYLLFYWNIDRPGMLAAVGTILAKSNINIAGLSLGRTAAGEKALTIVHIDSDIPQDVIVEIGKISGVMDPKVVRI